MGLLSLFVIRIILNLSKKASYNLEPRSPTDGRKGAHISASNRVRSGFEIRLHLSSLYARRGREGFMQKGGIMKVVSVCLGLFSL